MLPIEMLIKSLLSVKNILEEILIFVGKWMYFATGNSRLVFDFKHDSTYTNYLKLI